MSRRFPVDTNTLVLVGALGLGAYWLLKNVKGLFTGNNPVTQGTPYQGAGIVATPAAIANYASGGLLEKFGSWLGTTTYGLTHPYAGITVRASSIVLSNGQEIPVSSVTVSPFNGTFTYQGATYKVQGPADETGTIYAVQT